MPTSIYSSKNIVYLCIMFVLIFWLIYSIASFWYQTGKITAEIDTIEQDNQDLINQITLQELELQYLETPQRIEKEAKMQMGKKLPGEQVIVFIEEESSLPNIKSGLNAPPTTQINFATPWERWAWLFWGK